MRRTKHGNSLARSAVFICILRESKLTQRNFFWKGYRYPHQIKKSVWIGKLSDPDFHTPSCPHLHSENGKKKLDVYTGEFYDVQTRTYTGEFIKQDVLKDLWTDEKFLRFVDQARDRLLSKFPNIKLPPIPHYDQQAQQETSNFKRIITIYYIPSIRRWR